MPKDQTRLGIAQNTRTGEYAVTIDAIRDGESEVKTYLDAPTARAMARSLNALADQVERRHADAALEAALAIETMQRTLQ